MREYQIGATESPRHGAEHVLPPQLCSQTDRFPFTVRNSSCFTHRTAAESKCVSVCVCVCRLFPVKVSFPDAGVRKHPRTGIISLAPRG